MNTRRIPIDFKAIAEESGLTRGKLCKTVFGWGVQNIYGDDGPTIVCVAPPPALPNETLVIDGNDWLFTSQ